MQYRAIACSTTLLLAILNFINSVCKIFELPEDPVTIILFLWIFLYALGIIIIELNKKILLKYDEIKGKHRIPYIVISLLSVGLIIFFFKS